MSLRFRNFKLSSCACHLWRNLPLSLTEFSFWICEQEVLSTPPGLPPQPFRNPGTALEERDVVPRKTADVWWTWFCLWGLAFIPFTTLIFWKFLTLRGKPWKKEERGKRKEERGKLGPRPGEHAAFFALSQLLNFPAFLPSLTPSFEKCSNP